MALAHSRLNARGRVTVPLKVRQYLGIGPGGLLEWEEEAGRIVVRKAGRYSSEDIHRVLFGRPAKTRTISELKDGLRRCVHARHARH